MRSTNEILSQIAVLRMNLLPPYTDDADEGERDADDYAAFFSHNLDRSIEALNVYERAIANFSANPAADESLDGLLNARALFVASFPFANDDLLNESKLPEYREQ